MTVFVVMIVQNSPLNSEHIHSIHLTEESAEVQAGELEYQLSKDFSIEVEEYPVTQENEDF